MEKYTEKFTVPDDVNFRKLSSWTAIAKQQIERWLDDEEFSEYISREVLKNDENPPGPFTRFLYWFGGSCEATSYENKIVTAYKSQLIEKIKNTPFPMNEMAAVFKIIEIINS